MRISIQMLFELHMISVYLNKYRRFTTPSTIINKVRKQLRIPIQMLFELHIINVYFHKYRIFGTSIIIINIVMLLKLFSDSMLATAEANVVGCS